MKKIFYTTCFILMAAFPAKADKKHAAAQDVKVPAQASLSLKKMDHSGTFSDNALLYANLTPTTKHNIVRPTLRMTLEQKQKINRGVFGSVAVVTTQLGADAKWNRLLKEKIRHLYSPQCIKNSEGQTCPGKRWRPWFDMHQKSARMSDMQQRLTYVNRTVNKLIQHVNDFENYGVSDYWASLSETVIKGRGDCEDFAIAKMWVLNMLGIPLDQMQLVVLRDREHGLNHAVLAVHKNGKAHILDNLMSTVKTSERLPFYQPIYSISSAGRWLHGFRQPDNTRVTSNRKSRTRL